VDGQGQLVTASGLQVAGGITIPAEAQSITVGKDGVITVKLPGNATPQQVGNIELASFVNPAGLEPLGGNLYSETVASGNPVNGAPGSNGMGQLMQGYVETSNVNVVQELVTMIQTQRAYEMNSKAIQTSDQMLQRLAQL
jgi:flagellar basal-body rod protein FlgG